MKRVIGGMVILAVFLCIGGMLFFAGENSVGRAITWILLSVACGSSVFLALRAKNRGLRLFSGAVSACIIIMPFATLHYWHDVFWIGKWSIVLSAVLAVPVLAGLYLVRINKA